MRISRKRKPKKPLIPFYKRNEKIEAQEVRVLGRDNENIGIMSIEDALARAREDEVDLVEINPKADPPVCKLIDFTQFKYQKEKEARKQKANTHVAELKGIRLSLRISSGDMDVRRKQAEKFLDRGDKVKVELMLRGRERGKADMGKDVIRQFTNLLSEDRELRFEQEIAMQGGKLTAIVTKK